MILWIDGPKRHRWLDQQRSWLAKLHKIGERENTPTRLVNKDVHDLYRILYAVSTDELVAAFERLLHKRGPWWGAISDFMIKACVVRTIAATGSRFLDHPRRLSGASGLRLRLAELGNGGGWGRIAAFFDDRQRAWRHLLHLRGELSS